VTDKPVTNVAHSVRQRLINEAKRTGRLYNEIEQYYAMERFLYRLAQSEHGGKFVLKGALLFTVWQGSRFRPTRDIDLLGRLDNSQEAVAQVFRSVCSRDVPDDGLVFDPASVATLAITEDADYQGIRVNVEGRLGTSRIRIQVDIGFSDVVVPAPVETDYPTILDYPAPRLKAYSRESVIAEKLEAMVSLGEGNSRMKDFADLWYLSRHFAFTGPPLTEAIAKTFQRRKTAIPQQPTAFTADFARLGTKQAQWKAFTRRSAPEGMPSEFEIVVEGISAFLGPILSHLAVGQPMPQHWEAPGPWQF
jgi:predicted nucleotidyltransferase component of viral defense system